VLRTEAARFLGLCFFIETLVAPLSGTGLEPRRVPHITEKSELRYTGPGSDWHWSTSLSSGHCGYVTFPGAALTVLSASSGAGYPGT